MIRALFTAASGMIIQERKQSMVSNNLSNSETTGFKVQELITKEKDKVMIQNREKRDNGISYMKNVGELSLGAEIDDIAIDFEQGILKESDSELDFALEGDGFFKIKWNEFQVGYTRNGQFEINEDGYLSTKDGKQVFAKYNQPIFVGEKSINVTDDGRIFIGDEEAYQFDIVNLNDVSNLNVIGSSIYLMDNAQEIEANDTHVYQNRIEASNINPLEEMVRMIEVSRSFESNQKVIQAVDQMLDKAVNSVGKV